MKFSAILSFAAMVVAVHAGFGDDDDSGNGGKGRRLAGISDLMSNERMWNEYKNTCGDVDYDIKFAVVTKTGHLEGFVAPHGDAPAACVPLYSDVMTQSYSGRNFKRVQAIQDVPAYLSGRETYDMGVRKFSDLAAAAELIKVDDSATYMSKLVPKNCGTYLLELGKILNLPIDSELMTFVVSNMKATMFMNDFSASTAYSVLSTESWFGNSRRLGASTAESMVRRLFEYMIDQQYPKELVKMD